MNEFAPTLSFKYVPEWGLKQIPREIISNAIDTGAKYRVYRDQDNLVIEDDGCGLQISNLLIGEHSSAVGDNSIGKFGEGLKLALMVWTRMGKKAQIRTGKLIIINDTKEVAGVKTLNFLYDEVEENFPGTRITLYEWDGEWDFSEQFLDVNDEDEILNKTSKGYILDTSRLYVRGVFIKELPDYEFGYNLLDATLNRDRNVVDEWQMHRDIGKIWEEVDSVSGWAFLFEAIKNHKMETMMNISSWYAQKEAMKEGFYKTFGKNAVMKTSDYASKEAEHRGAKIVDSEIFGNHLQSVLKEFIGTDVDYVNKKRGEKAFDFSESSLTPEQKKNLSLLRKIGRKCGFDKYTIKIAKLPNSLGLAMCGQNIIKLHPDCLIETHSAIDVYIHEVAHMVYNSNDNGDDHVNACTKTAATITMCLMGLK
jgi:hypothetical protein